MSQAIVRGIWGDGAGHSDGNLERTVLESKQNGDPVDKVYCFGIKNRKMLERHGYKPEMLDPEPIASPRIPGARDRYERSSRRWGVSHWWHKIQIIEAALQEFDHVLSQDFDVRLQQALPLDFWDELKSGASFRAPLTIQRSGSRGAWWRMPATDKRRRRQLEVGQPPLTKVSNYQQARVMPAGGYVYTRGISTVARLIALRNRYPCWNSQPIFALMIDQEYGGWPGVQKYIDYGHEVRGYFYGGSLIRPEPRQTIWMSGPREVQKGVKETRRFWEAW